jgi:hypothetical protein
MMSHLNVLPANWARASATFPVHFQELVSCGWRDVTEEWSVELQSAGRAIDSPRSSHGQIVMQREGSADALIKETQGWAELQEDFGNLVNGLSTHLDDLMARATK